MNKFLLILVTVLSTSISFGQAAAPAALVVLPETLENTMDAMGDNLKAVGTNFMNPTLKDTTVTASANLVLLAVHAQTLVPSKILEAPVEAQAELTAKYKSLLSQLSETAVQVLSAVQSGKIDLVPALLNDLKAIKKDGHTEFKPPQK